VVASACCLRQSSIAAVRPSALFTGGLARKLITSPSPSPPRNGRSQGHLCSEHAEIARRYRAARKPFVFADKRLEELERLMRHQHGRTLPDNDEGRRFVTVLANHLGEAKRIRIWLNDHAPWYGEDDADELIERVERRRTRWRADTIASTKWLNVSYAERLALGLETIGAFDMPKEQRKQLRRERYRPKHRQNDRRWKAKQRRAKGCKPREQYEAESASRTRPWEAFGISRST
jgi:hypothetical protein